MQLFLSSAGLPKEVRESFLEILPGKPEDLKVAFIPTAAYPEINQTYLELAKDELKRMGFVDIIELDIKNEQVVKIEEVLNTSDIVYVNGGNTFFLLHWVRQSGFDKILKVLKNKEMIYLGVSAGSYIACPTIEMANWKHQDRNVVGMEDFTALNLVPFLLTAHFEDNHKQAIFDGARSTPLPVVALNDKQAIVVSNHETRLIGDQEKNFFNDFEKIITNN